ncbi:MAG: type VII secretion system-associated protein [Actinomycetes bacterium]
MAETLLPPEPAAVLRPPLGDEPPGDTPQDASPLDRPDVDEPAYDEPPYAAPRYDDPVAHEPAYDTSALDEPSSEHPRAGEAPPDEPVVTELSHDEPTPEVELPHDQPAADEPPVEDPLASSSGADDATRPGEAADHPTGPHAAAAYQPTSPHPAPGAPAPPPITDTMREQARSQPDSWLYALDPGFSPDTEVPPEGIVGAFRVDTQGEIAGGWTPNPHYRPTPAALRMPRPTDAVDHAAQLVRTGWGSLDAVVRALESADLRVSGDAADALHLHRVDGVGQCVFVFTHPSHVDAAFGAEPSQAKVTLAGLRDVLARDAERAAHLTVLVNPYSPASVKLPAPELLAAGS